MSTDKSSNTLQQRFLLKACCNAAVWAMFFIPYLWKKKDASTMVSLFENDALVSTIVALSTFVACLALAIFFSEVTKLPFPRKFNCVEIVMHDFSTLGINCASSLLSFTGFHLLFYKRLPTDFLIIVAYVSMLYIVAFCLESAVPHIKNLLGEKSGEGNVHQL